MTDSVAYVSMMSQIDLVSVKFKGNCSLTNVFPSPPGLSSGEESLYLSFFDFISTNSSHNVTIIATTTRERVKEWVRKQFSDPKSSRK